MICPVCAEPDHARPHSRVLVCPRMVGAHWNVVKDEEAGHHVMIVPPHLADEAVKMFRELWLV